MAAATLTPTEDDTFDALFGWIARTLEHVGRNVRALGLDVVVAIGGDGTMSLAH